MLPEASRRGLLTLASLAVLLGAADTYVVVLLLPDIASGVGLDSLQLARAAPLVSGFLLGYVALLPAAGRLSDVVGRRAVLVGALAVFTVGAVVTASADQLGQAVAGRLLQGLGGGAVVPTTLALVADRWPPERRALPLGLVGAVQEAGAVAGPLLGALVLTLADWRWVFWAVAVVGALLAVSIAAGMRSGQLTRRRDRLELALLLAAAGAGLLLVVRPEALTSSVRLGALFVPGSLHASPLLVGVLVLLALALAREVTTAAPVLQLRRWPQLARDIDAWGAALAAGALGALVISFAAADPERTALSPAARYLLPLAALLGTGFALRQRTAARPLVPRSALGRHGSTALAVSLLVGAALVTALVVVPIFVRVTIRGSDQSDAALVLLRLLTAVPVGAVAGGWLTRRLGPRVVAVPALLLVSGALLTMAAWSPSALRGPAATASLALIAAGLGFGLALAPVAAAALDRVPAAAHGLASALVVVARTVGMLVGLSALSAVGLHVFRDRVRRLAPPEVLCPTSPADCSPYAALLRSAVVSELHVMLAAAAAFAAVGAVICLTLPVRFEGASGRFGSGIRAARLRRSGGVEEYD